MQFGKNRDLGFGVACLFLAWTWKKLANLIWWCSTGSPEVKWTFFWIVLIEYDCKLIFLESLFFKEWNQFLPFHLKPIFNQTFPKEKSRLPLVTLYIQKSLELSIYPKPTEQPTMFSGYLLNLFESNDHRTTVH